MINIWPSSGITSVPDLKMPHRKNDCPVYQISVKILEIFCFGHYHI